MLPLSVMTTQSHISSLLRHDLLLHTDINPDFQNKNITNMNIKEKYTNKPIIAIKVNLGTRIIHTETDNIFLIFFFTG